MHRNASSGQAAATAVFGYIGLIGTSLAAAGNEDVSEAPESPFSVEEIKIPGELATNFLVPTIQIGKGTDRVFSTNSIPGTLLSHKTPYIPREWGVVRTTQNFTMNVTNNSQAASTFRAGVSGYGAPA